jgi:hypothetical protein
MSESQQNIAPPDPPNSGVAPKQVAPIEIVTSVPENTRDVGGLMQYPLTEAVREIRTGGSKFDNDAALVLLSSHTSRLERDTVLSREETQKLRDKIENLLLQVQSLAIEKATLVEQLRGVRQANLTQTVLTTIGGLGVGVFASLSFTGHPMGYIISAVLFFAVLLIGLLYQSIFQDGGGK